MTALLAAAVRPEPLSRAGEHLAHVRDRRRDGRELDELGARVARHDARQRRLAAPGRAVEDEGRHPVGLDREAKRLPRADHLRLPDEVVERCGAEALGERRNGLEAPARRFIEEIGHNGQYAPGAAW